MNVWYDHKVVASHDVDYEDVHVREDGVLVIVDDRIEHVYAEWHAVALEGILCAGALGTSCSRCGG